MHAHVILLFLAIVPLGCSSSSDDSGAAPQSSSPAADPAACDADCDRQASTGCGLDAPTCKQFAPPIGGRLPQRASPPSTPSIHAQRRR